MAHISEHSNFSRKEKRQTLKAKGHFEKGNAKGKEQGDQLPVCRNLKIVIIK